MIGLRSWGRRGGVPPAARAEKIHKSLGPGRGLGEGVLTHPGLRVEIFHEIFNVKFQRNENFSCPSNLFHFINFNFQ